jgi:hypothetical protein
MPRMRKRNGTLEGPGLRKKSRAPRPGLRKKSRARKGPAPECATQVAAA